MSTMMSKLLVPTLASSIVLFSQPIWADAQVQYTNGADTQTALVKNGKVLIRNAGDPSTEMLFDAATRTMTVIQHNEKNYMVLDEATIENLAGQLGGMRDMINQQMANLPPEQREQLAAFLGGAVQQPEQKAEVVVTTQPGGSLTVNGVTCSNQVVLRNGAASGSFCTAGAGAAKLSEGDYKTLVSMQTFMFDMAKKAKDSMGSLAQQVPDFGNLSIDKLVVKGEMSDSPDNRFELKSVASAAVSEPMVIPEGYTQQSMGSLSDLMNR